ncbi:MAG: NAD(P)/FAD-dependent oxidoreductase [Flavobacteriales bacterium]|nr:NAD(P)/FAD-dependent oxidoreductase [Flavobacteriales bacterium]
MPIATDLLIVGGGAAGIFAAIRYASGHPEHKVLVLEKSPHLLSKVKVSGGGRCNVTHACFEPEELITHYPRGGRELLGAFHRFQPANTVSWFKDHGVNLKTEADGRMFPVSDRSQTIIDCFLKEVKKHNITIEVKTTVTSITQAAAGFEIRAGEKTILSPKVILAMGGSPKGEAYDMIRQLGHTIVPTVPSLFTFNLPGSDLLSLQGLVTPVTLTLPGNGLTSSGPLLVTHWGVSGPAVLKLSAWAARWLNEQNYHFKFLVDWLPDTSEEMLTGHLMKSKDMPGAVTASKVFPPGLPKRLQAYLLDKSGIDANRRWAEIGKKQVRELVRILKHDEYEASGKTTFKEEFVQCGGVTLKEVDMTTMESKLVPGLYFAGEVLDIDGVTGGFNFQAAWTTGFLAGSIG